jgi:uncharacterized membrane protein YpjA
MPSVRLRTVTLVYTFVGYMLIAEMMRVSTKAIESAAISASCRFVVIALLFAVCWALYNDMLQREFAVENQSALRPL